MVNKATENRPLVSSILDPINDFLLGMLAL